MQYRCQMAHHNYTMSKPRIFIQLHYLEIGGAEKALLGLLDAIDKDRFEVDLFLNQHTGPFMNLIPEGINLLPEIPEYAALEQPLAYAIKHRLWRSVINKFQRKHDLTSYLKKKEGYDAVASHVYMERDISSLPNLYHLGEYDLAISFLDPPHIVQDKVLAKTKAEWIHTDFSAIKYDADLTFDRWQRNDYIISISDSITESFLKLFPSLSHKIRVIENIISSKFVREQSQVGEEEDTKEANRLTICSLGRINAYPKNFNSIPIIARLLKSRGLPFKWQIIGPGDDTEIKQLIKENGVENEILLLGPKANPYPYIANCDIYVQPSIFEGKSIAVREAQILCKPVIITNYPTAKSQITNGVDGIICEMDNESIANAIMNLANNESLQTKLSAYLAANDYGLTSEVEKLYTLI